MFKQSSFENEIFRSMEKTLVKNQTENTTQALNKLAKAVDYLNDAAAIFEYAGMLEEASLITEVLFSMAKDLDSSGDARIKVMRFLEEVKSNLIVMSGDDAWKLLPTKNLAPEVDTAFSPEKNAEIILVSKNLSPDYFYFESHK